MTGDAELVASMRPRRSLLLTDLLEQPTALRRAPGFCAGCPHNTGTLVPEGSFNIGGTGCHGMATMQDAPGRDTHMFTHMGGEGAFWIGMAPFADVGHTFQNMGDGTYFHSGVLAIRAAIAAGVDITFKILLNGYISMTGGQAIPGGLSAQDVSRQVLAEGARQVVVVSDDPTRYDRRDRFPAGVEVHPRQELLAVEERLRDTKGVTVLVYDQACAAELRRDRKHGQCRGPRQAGVHPRGGLRGLRGLQRAIELHLGGAAGDRRWGASGRSTSRAATRTSPVSTVTARAS